MTILCDRQIKELADDGMITPFEPKLIRVVTGWKNKKVLSYGLSSYGYDIRLSSKEFRVFRHVPGHIVNPKAFNTETLEKVELQSGQYGEYFILPAHSYGLGVALEKLDMPVDITAIAIGKSTYARCGIIANLTPIESGWKGNLTIELSNSSGADCRIYANEGICQLLFLRGEPCETSYETRQGKYQNQPEKIVFSKV
jgi:dCTP deaminase